MSNPLTPLFNSISKMFRGPRVGDEGSWQPAYGLGEWGGIFRIPLGDGFQRNLSGSANYRSLIATACVNTYVGALASCGLDHIRHLPGGGVEILKDSAISKVLRYPNFLQQQSQFLAYVVSSLATTGNFYVYANQRDARNIPTSLMPLQPQYNRAVLSDDGNSVWYDVSSERKFFIDSDPDVLVPSRDVAHGKLSSHRSLLTGESPLSDAGYTLALNQSLLASSERFINNMARPSGIVSVDATLTSSQMAELRDKFNEFSSGPNAGKVPILGGGAKWQPLTITAVDAQIMEMYSMTVVDICRAYRIPPQLLGMENNGTASSVEILINQWRATGLLYYAETIERTFERLFDLPADEEIRFDLDNIARADFKTMIETLSKGVQNAIYSPNEARAKVGMPPAEHGDSPRIQAQNVRLEDAVPAPSAPSAPSATAGQGNEDDPDDDLEDDPEDDDNEDSVRSRSVKVNKAYDRLIREMKNLEQNDAG